MTTRRLGLREFLRAVNVADFLDMVRTELSLIRDAVGQAGSHSPRMLPLALLMAALRLALLLGVIVVFGGGIVIITATRAIARRISGTPLA